MAVEGDEGKAVYRHVGLSVSQEGWVSNTVQRRQGLPPGSGYSMVQYYPPGHSVFFFVLCHP